MKKIFCLIIVLFFTVGCASQQAYTAYANAMIQANAYKKAPGIVQEFDATGKLVKQTFMLPDNGVQVAQIKDSEWTNTVNNVLGMSVVGLTSGWVMHEAKGIIKATRSNTYDSHNVAGGNMGGNTAGANLAGGDVTTSSIPTTTTTTTTTTD